MSCRVLQRGVECAFAGWLGAQLAPWLSAAGASLRLVYRATGRNAPVGPFLQQLGVTAEAQDAEAPSGVELAVVPAQLAAAGRAHAPWVRVEAEPMDHAPADTAPPVAVGA
jgi:hypothetical protein